MSLFAHYPFNGDLKDYSGNGYDLNFPSPNLSNAGKIGKSLTITQAITFPFKTNMLKNSTASLSFWLYVSSGDYNCALFQADGTNTVNDRNIFNCFQYPTRNDFHWDMRDTNGNYIYTGVLSGIFPDNTWTHVAIVINKNKGLVYINGIKKNEVSFPANAIIKVTNNNLMFYGAGGLTRLNDVRIYNHALSLNEIKEVYKTKILHYKFDSPEEEATINLQNSAYPTTPNNGIDNFGSYFIKTINDAWNLGINLTTTPVKAGSTYTWSFEVYSDTAFVSAIDPNCSASNYAGNDLAMSSTILKGDINIPAYKWSKVAVTVTIQSDAVSPSLYHSFCPGVPSTELKVYYRNFQLEEKQEFTPFTLIDRKAIASDASGFNNIATANINTTPIWSKDRIVGSGCMKFNGNGQFFLMNKAPIEPIDLTISAWIKPNATYNTGIRHIWLTKWYGYSMEIQPGTMKPYFRLNGPGDCYSSINLEKEKWFHLVGTFQSGVGSKIYINGVLTGTLNTTTLIGHNNDFPLCIGRWGGGEFFDGSIDDVRIYATALTQKDITELYEVKTKADKMNNIYSDEFICRDFDFIETKVEDGATWAKIFWQNSRQGTEVFSSLNEFLFTNTTSKFSILKYLDNFRNSNGELELLLEYPGRHNLKNRWKQISNFIYEDIKGYVPISIQMTTQFWGGLAPCSNGGAYVDGSPGDATWYYSIGTKNNYNGGMPAENDPPTQLVYLWARIDNLPEYNKMQITRKGQLNNINLHECNFKPTLIDYSTWTPGIMPSGWSLCGTPEENGMYVYGNPWGMSDIMWGTEYNDPGATDADGSGPDGGFNGYVVQIDNTKKYRFSIWLRRENIGAGSGSTYVGCAGIDPNSNFNGIINLGDNSVNGNPYFLAAGYAAIPELNNQWILVVGYVHPNTYTGVNDITNGMYNTNGIRFRELSDYKWSTTATKTYLRSYLYYSSKTDERQYFYRPRIDLCDGSEPTIADLLACRDHTPLWIDGNKVINNNITMKKSGIITANQFIER